MLGQPGHCLLLRVAASAALCFSGSPDLCAACCLLVLLRRLLLLLLWLLLLLLLLLPELLQLLA